MEACACEKKHCDLLRKPIISILCFRLFFYDYDYESLVTKLRFSDRNAVNLLASVPFSTRLRPPPLQGRGVTF